ncbi:MAG: LacI family DNA-binding transcriptional regulator [Oscillospiraceae bacterium]|nr:LacI family DNA-binding transcriptional regulator [Oscillospiraceae bacterium]
MESGVGKKVTIDQVARLCGVSKTTVSRFLNHKYENISEETRRRIERVIEELDYRPNRSAQRLKASRSMLIGCCVGDLSGPFSGLLLRGITRVCEAAGYQVLFADSSEDKRKERKALEGFLENSVDGLIVNTTGGNDAFLIEVAERGVPVTLADRSLRLSGRLDTVINEYETCIRDSIRLMLDCGYTRIAFFTEQIREVMPRIQRRDSYIAAMRSLAPEGAGPFLYEFDRFDPVGCRRSLEAYRVAFPGERIAILAVNGVTGQQLLKAAKELGFRFGEQIGLCTFDDWAIFSLADVTAIRLQTEEVGEAAARMLLERIGSAQPENMAPRSVELTTGLIVRHSTAKASTGG